MPTDAQKFRAEDAFKTAELVAQIRTLLDTVPIAIARTAIAILNDDIQAQLNFRKSEFQL